MNVNHNVVVVTDPVTHQLFYGGLLWPIIVATVVMVGVGILTSSIASRVMRRGADISIPVVIACLIAGIATLKYMGAV